jgi:hypothetical protein
MSYTSTGIEITKENRTIRIIIYLGDSCNVLAVVSGS